MPRDEILRAPRYNPQPYTPGFGGHARHRNCKCTEAHEYVCGRVHPDRPESAAQVERRRRTALVLAAREVRESAWRAEFAGKGQNRVESLDMLRKDRKLTPEESKKALDYFRKRLLPRRLWDSRTELCAQAWLELRQPPKSSTVKTFAAELRQAWERALKVLEKENEPSNPIDF
jgi:hypothetical protein